MGVHDRRSIGLYCEADLSAKIEDAFQAGSPVVDVRTVLGTRDYDGHLSGCVQALSGYGAKSKVR